MVRICGHFLVYNMEFLESQFLESHMVITPGISKLRVVLSLLGNIGDMLQY